MKIVRRSPKDWLSYLFNTSILKKDRYPWVDYLRGIAIILVVYRHVLIGLERSKLYVPEYLVRANEIFYSFRMPLFFILSGIFINGTILKRSFSRLLYIKFENLFYPYLVWAFIQVSLQIALGSYTNANRSLIDYTYILYQPRALDQFWYLPALFNTTMIYVLVKTKLRPSSWIQLLVGICLYLLSPYFERVTMISDWMEFYFFFALGDAITDFFFKERVQRFLRSHLTLILVIPVFVATQLYYLNQYSGNRVEFLLIALIGCFSMFVLAFNLQVWNILSFLRVLGFHSLYIYVMHVMIAALVRAVLTKVVGIENSVILLLSGIAAGVIIPVILYNLFIRDNFAWRLFYLTKPTNKKIAKTAVVKA